MRIFSVGIVSMFLVIAVGAQTAAPKKPAEPAVHARAAVGTLAQLMRGIYFPNANPIFDVQAKDPGAPSEKNNAAGGGPPRRLPTSIPDGRWWRTRRW